MNICTGASSTWIKRVAPAEGPAQTIKADVSVLNDLQKHHVSILHRKIK